jgi:hypothetical protein
MITLPQCDSYANECRSLATSPDCSIQRATALMAVCRAWLMLREHLARYHAIMNEEKSN